MPRASHLFVAVLVALLVAMCSARPHEGTSAHLLVLKSVDKEHAVVSQNLTVSLNIFNVGQSPAFDIEINDGDSDEVGLSLVGGLRIATIEKIAPGENVTHTYVVNPILSGVTSSAPAKISYKLEPKGEETREVQSNALSSIAVLTLEEHSRQTAKHYTEWIVFLVLSTLLVYAPHHTYKTALKNLSA